MPEAESPRAEIPEAENPEAETQLTQLLAAYSRGEDGAFDRLVSRIYGQLRGVARGQLWRHSGETLNTTGLVHEAYIKLVDQTGVVWQDRQHFFCIAASAMRQILVDHARKRLAEKRGAGFAHTGLDRKDIAEDRSAEEVVAVNAALESLAELGERLVQVVEYRYFCGFTIEETADLLGVGTRTVERDWKKARAWLKAEMAP